MAKQHALDISLIEHFYEVAIEPASYEQMLDHWEALLRPSLDADALPAEINDTIARLSPHLERADRVLAQTMAAPPGETASEAVGRILHAASFAIDMRGHLLVANRAAVQTLGITGGARLAILPLEEGESARLREASRDLLAANASATRVLSLRALGSGRLIVAHLRLYRPATEAPFVLCVTSEIVWPEGFSAQMRRSFDLSDIELEILRHLTEGYSVRDIADLRARSVETVRVQVKSMLARTGLRSQVELVRLSLSVVESLRDSAPDSDAAALPAQPVLPRRCPLSGGRHLEYLTLGAQDGRPVLFLPIDLGFTRLPPAAEAEARRRGLRLIVPIRAGYGGSSPAPPGPNYFTSMMRDHIELLDHLRLDRVPVLTQGDDSLLAIQLHAAAPGRLSALICCAGVMPMTPAQLKRMGKWHRFILTGAKYTPDALSFMVKAGAALARRYGKRKFLQSVYAGSAADTATFALPEVAETLIRSSDVMLSESHSGHDAFAREQIAKFVADWEHPLERLRLAVEAGRMKVHFYNGSQDPQVPPETFEDYLRDYDWIDFTLYEDAGQLVLYLKWRDVLGRLDQIA